MRGAVDSVCVSQRDDSRNMFLSLRVEDEDKDNSLSQTGAGQGTHKGGRLKGQLLSCFNAIKRLKYNEEGGFHTFIV